MTARDAMLAAVRGAKPAAVPRPELAKIVGQFGVSENLVGAFAESARLAGATVLQTTREGVTALVGAALEPNQQCVSMLDVDGVRQDATALEFANTDLFVCEGVIGVAETGAVWLPLSRLGHRAALFLAANVIIVLEQSRIVGNVHDAYSAINVADEECGVFVAGPSKTADIEQLLVIGAHGPKALTVLLVEA